MATANDILKIAAGEIGYYAPDDPEPGSKYGRWMAELLGEDWLAGPSTDVWWCCIFVSWVLAKANQSVPGFPSYNTDVAWSKAKSRSVLKENCKPGDIVIFDWNMGTAATDHIGFVEKNFKNGYIQTIEGNTSGTDWGSQYAGNGVHRRTRSLDVVRYCIRPAYDDAPKRESFTKANYTVTFNQRMNVRSGPSLGHDIVSWINGNVTWTMDGFVINDGYIWGTYIGPKTGERLYIALGHANYVL